jgi:hypothetical protein
MEYRDNFDDAVNKGDNDVGFIRISRGNWERVKNVGKTIKYVLRMINRKTLKNSTGATLESD